MIRPRNNFSPESQPWSRAIEAEINQFRLDSAKSAQDNINAFKALNSSMKAVSNQIVALNGVIRALPELVTGSNTTTGFGLSSGWNTCASVTLTTPVNKYVAAIAAFGSAAAVDLTTGGVTVCRGRVVVNGTAGQTVYAAKDAGASAVNNIITAHFARNGVVGDTSTITFDLNPLNPTAFGTNAANYATLTVIASYVEVIVFD